MLLCFAFAFAAAIWWISLPVELAGWIWRGVLRDKGGGYYALTCRPQPGARTLIPVGAVLLGIMWKAFQTTLYHWLDWGNFQLTLKLCFQSYSVFCFLLFLFFSDIHKNNKNNKKAFSIIPGCIPVRWPLFPDAFGKKPKCVIWHIYVRSLTVPCSFSCLSCVHCLWQAVSHIKQRH